MTNKDDFDTRNGVDTATIVPRWRLLMSSSNAIHGTRYQPVDESELLTALDFFKNDFKTFTFVDLGCGKGRPLVIAERYGFRQTIGVEHNDHLAEIARRNVRKATIIHGDASDFDFPNGNVVLFLYNPFSSKIMRKVVDRITMRTSGAMYVLYKYPRCADLFDTSKSLMPLGKIPGTLDFFAWKSANARELR